MWLGRLAAPPPRLTFPLQRAVLACHDPRLDRVGGGARPMIGISLRQRRGRRWLSRRWLNDGRRGACPISACGAALASGPLRAASARSNYAFAAATRSTSLRSNCATAEARAAARVDTTSQYSVQNLIETPPARHDIVGLI